MRLCTYSKSEHLSDCILSSCPLSIKQSAASRCPCKSRAYVPFGGVILRVMECHYPDDFRGDPITVGPTEAQESLKERKKWSEIMSNTQLVAHADKPTEAQRIEEFPRFDNPLAAVEQLGKSFYESCMFGCESPAQGKVLAMICVFERQSPQKILRRNHIIKGKLSMKADAMLADFRAMGGEYTIIERTPDVVSAEFSFKSNRNRVFKFTWDEAKIEDYTKAKGGALKENWSTGRRKMQMLWARLVSDAVRCMAPEVNAGQYTPEELGEELTGEMEPEQSGRKAKAAKDRVETIEVTVAPAKPAEQSKPMESPATTPAAEATPKPEPTPPATIATESQGDDMVTREQLERMAELKQQLANLGQMDKATWTAVCGKFGVQTAKDLDKTQASSVLAWLEKRSRTAQTSQNIDEWAKGISQSSGNSSGG